MKQNSEFGVQLVFEYENPYTRTTNNEHNYIVRFCIDYKQYLCDQNDLIAFEIVCMSDIDGM